MEKQINLRLLDLLTTDMSTEQVEQIRIHVEILIDGYHKAQTRIGDLELELASIKFDRDCLIAEHRNQPGAMCWHSSGPKTLRMQIYQAMHRLVFVGVQEMGRGQLFP